VRRAASVNRSVNVDIVVASINTVYVVAVVSISTIVAGVDAVYVVAISSAVIVDNVAGGSVAAS
jgi:hypothetical protein